MYFSLMTINKTIAPLPFIEDSVTELLHFALAFVISLEFWNSEFFLSLGGIRTVIASEFYFHKLRVTLHSTIEKSPDEQYDLIFPLPTSGDPSMFYSCHCGLIFVFPLCRR